MQPITSNPYENTRMAKFIALRISQLAGRKSQKDIAEEIGLVNPNVISMWKSGRNKVPLDRVPGLAKTLEADPVEFCLLALEQDQNDAVMAVLRELVALLPLPNECEWLRALRKFSGGTDPILTKMRRKILHAIFS